MRPRVRRLEPDREASDDANAAGVRGALRAHATSRCAARPGAPHLQRPRDRRLDRRGGAVALGVWSVNPSRRPHGVPLIAGPPSSATGGPRHAGPQLHLGVELGCGDRAVAQNSGDLGERCAAFDHSRRQAAPEDVGGDPPYRPRPSRASRSRMATSRRVAAATRRRRIGCRDPPPAGVKIRGSAAARASVNNAEGELEIHHLDRVPWPGS